MKLFELRKALADKSAEGRKIVQAAIDAQRALTPEEEARVAELRGEVGDLQRKITLFETRDRFDSLSPEERAARDGGRLGPELPDLDGNHPYSLVRALNMQLAVREGKGRYDGLEWEVHQELERHADRRADGIRVPWSLANRSLAGQAGRVERRDLTTATGAGAIDQNVLGTELITILRNRMVMRAMGARVIAGLTGGAFSLPKQTAASTAYHVAEENAPTGTNPTFGQVTWTPRTVGAVVNTSRKALLQTSLDFEAITRADLVASIALEFDRVGVNGAGNNHQPMGVLQDPSVAIVAIGTNGGDPTWAMAVELETTVAVGNADVGSMGYLTSNHGRGKLKTTPKIGTTYPTFLWESNEVNGYRAMASNQVPSNLGKGSGTNLTALIFGNFESATYGLWSGLDILVDPYTGSSTGAVKITCFQDYDFALRYSESFAKCVDMAR